MTGFLWVRMLIWIILFSIGWHDERSTRKTSAQHSEWKDENATLDGGDVLFTGDCIAFPI